MAGNEDVGQMSAWYILSAIGFYSVDPVSTKYILGTPLFEKVTINLANDKKLIVEATAPNPPTASTSSQSNSRINPTPNPGSSTQT